MFMATKKPFDISVHVLVYTFFFFVKMKKPKYNYLFRVKINDYFFTTNIRCEFLLGSYGVLIF